MRCYLGGNYRGSGQERPAAWPLYVGGRSERPALSATRRILPRHMARLETDKMGEREREKERERKKEGQRGRERGGGEREREEGGESQTSECE